MSGTKGPQGGADAGPGGRSEGSQSSTDQTSESQPSLQLPPQQQTHPPPHASQELDRVRREAEGYRLKLRQAEKALAKQTELVTGLRQSAVNTRLLNELKQRGNVADDAHLARLAKYALTDVTPEWGDDGVTLSTDVAAIAHSTLEGLGLLRSATDDAEPATPAEPEPASEPAPVPDENPELPKLRAAPVFPHIGQRPAAAQTEANGVNRYATPGSRFVAIAEKHRGDA